LRLIAAFRKSIESLTVSAKTFIERPRLPLAVLAIILLTQFAFVIWYPKGVSWDPSYGLLAAQQHLAGVSSSIFTLVEADPKEITQSSERKLTYWAPAYQAIPYSLHFGVLDWGVALRITLSLVLIIGVLGWFVYFAQVIGSVVFALWLSAVVALTKFRWAMGLAYLGGDQLTWCATSWVLIIAAAAVKSAHRGSMTPARTLSALAGALGASLVALKYSGVFVAIGAAVVFVVYCVRHRYWQLIIWAGAGFIAVAGAFAWFWLAQAATPAASTHPMSVTRAVASFGLVATGVTDLDPILRVIFHAILTSIPLDVVELTVSFIGVGLSVVLLIGFLAFGRFRSAALFAGDPVLVTLGIGAVGANLFILFLLHLKGGNISLDGRFGRESGLLLLPLVVSGWQAMIRQNHLMWRAFAAAGIMTFLVLPTTLETVRQLPRLIDRFLDAPSETNLEGVVNIALTPGTDARAFYAEVETISPGSLLYTIYPQMAFPLPKRPLILVEAEELETPATLSARRYHGRPKEGVALLLPIWFEQNGKLAAIEASFVDLHHFIRHELQADRKWALWVGLD
jgi:hypothetical protein